MATKKQQATDLLAAQSRSNVKPVLESTQEAPPNKAVEKRTSIILSERQLRLLTLLKLDYQLKESRTITQSELCGEGLELLAQQRGIEA